MSAASTRRFNTLESECQRWTLVLCNRELSKCSDGCIFHMSLGYLPPRILNFRPFLMETTARSSHSRVIILNCEKDPFRPDQYCLRSSLIFAPRQSKYFSQHAENQLAMSSVDTIFTFNSIK